MADVAADVAVPEGVPATATASSEAAAAPAAGRQLASERDLQIGFDFLDPERKGMITPRMLKAGLAPFYDSLTLKECKKLLNGQDSMTVSELRELLTGEVIGSFDPTREAFREVYDLEGHGFIPVNRMRKIFTQICGVGIGSEDIEVLVRAADADKDGRIGVEDFRSLLS
jgi:Ca2+-binding EF-hand superfamily protein